VKIFELFCHRIVRRTGAACEVAGNEANENRFGELMHAAAAPKRQRFFHDAAIVAGWRKSAAGVAQKWRNKKNTFVVNPH
jgi:hypothetical protein